MSPVLLAAGPSVATGSRFIGCMEEKRRGRGLSDRAWAEYLGISPSYWVRLRNGQRNLSMSVAQRVMGEWPEFQLLLAHDLRLSGLPAGGAAGSAPPTVPPSAEGSP